MNPSNLIGSYDFSVSRNNFRQDVFAGLSKTPKSLPPKYFYDEQGSELFNQICETPEYYLTRTETSILAEHAREILQKIPQPIHIIELGSGSSSKTRYLLESSQSISAYVPIDISKEHLLHSTRALAQKFPEIPMLPVCADYTQLTSLPLMESRNTSHPMAFFPGSTLGNLDEDEAIDLLKNIHRLLDGEGYLLLGIDLIKDPKILEAAYNDAMGVTAAFNLNLLLRINRELDADFDISTFQHKALFNPIEKRIEMHLQSLRRQVVRISDFQITFDKDETIHTESSYKYDLQDFARFCQGAGFAHLQSWTDPKGLFGVVLLQARVPVH